MEVQNEQNCHLILSLNVQRKQKDESTQYKIVLICKKEFDVLQK